MTEIVNILNSKNLAPEMKAIMEARAVTLNRCLETVMEQVLKRDWYYDDIENFVLVRYLKLIKKEYYLLYYIKDEIGVYVGSIEIAYYPLKGASVEFTPCPILTNNRFATTDK